MLRRQKHALYDPLCVHPIAVSECGSPAYLLKSRGCSFNHMLLIQVEIGPRKRDVQTSLGRRTSTLVAQCQIFPPFFAQCPFEIGGIACVVLSHAFCLVFIGIARVPLRYPFVGGYRTSTSHALQGGNAQKRGRG